MNGNLADPASPPNHFTRTRQSLRVRIPTLMDAFSDIREYGCDEGGPVIDLTFDSEDDDVVPVAPAPKAVKKTPIPLPENIRHLYPSSPRQTPVPLPENVRHLYGQSPTLRSPSVQSNNPTPPARPHSTTSNPSSARVNKKKAPVSGANGGNGNYVSPYTPTPDTSSVGNDADEQARKRRKLSSTGNTKLVQSSPRPLPAPTRSLAEFANPSSEEDDTVSRSRAGGDARKELASLRTTHHSTGKLSSMKGVPTLGYLQAALKSGNAVEGISKNILDKSFVDPKGRVLQIGRVSEETETEDGHGQGVQTMLPFASEEPELGESDLEENGWDDMDITMANGNEIETSETADDILEAYQARKSPLKRPDSGPRREHGTPTLPVSVSTLATIPAVSSPMSNGSSRPKRQHRSPNLPYSDSTPITTAAASSPQLNGVNGQQYEQSSPASHATNNNRRRITIEEQHLLIYLKERLQWKWQDIKKEFPTRSMGVLQSHYCTTLNRRDRSKDPPVLRLPPKFGGTSTAMPVSPRRTDLSLPRQTLPHHPSKAPSHHSSHPAIERPRREDQVRQRSNYEHSPFNESTNHRGPGRSRRNVQAVNYTWPRQRNRRSGAIEEFEDDSVVLMDPSRSPEPLPSEESSGTPEFVLPVVEPTDVDFAYEDAHLVTSGEKLPYLSHDERSVVRAGPTNGEWNQITSRSWQGSVFHVDFSYDELQIAEEVAERVLYSAQHHNGSIHKRLRAMLKNQSEPRLLHFSHELQRKLPSRNRASVDGFIQDARQGKITKRPRIERMGAARPNKAFSSAARLSTSEMIRQRELGLQSRRGWKAASTPLSYQMKNNVYDTLGPVYSFTGASSDIHTVAWSPDSRNFAAGAVCITDRDSMQYNRRNNLLFGDVEAQTVQELAEHRRLRERPESGPNSTHEMHTTQDAHLYYTVASVAFSKNGEYMFSAGYDKSAIVWEMFERETRKRLTQPILLRALKHKAEVDLLTVSCQDKLATATRRYQKAIKVCSIQNDEVITQTYSSTKSDDRPDLKILPTALQFEPTYGRLLLAGFGANLREDRLDTTGDICLWDVETGTEIAVHGSTRNIFDVAWLPKQVYSSVFAVGCVAGSNVNKGTRSTVRIFDGRGFEKRSYIFETECPALDMNDVVVCPYDENLVAAGCTSGRTYVWDLRNPDCFLYSLSHGKSLMPLDEYQDREVTDTGVRFLSWGENATRLYTGSSDGVVKVWDVARSLEDVFIKDLVTFDSGIMSGAFNSDMSKLVLGAVNGSVNVLEVGNDDRSIKDVPKLRHLRYEEEFAEGITVKHAEDSGREIATNLLETGEIINVPFGGFPVGQAVQGALYRGPFDNGVDAPFLREQALEFQLSLAQAPEPQCNIPSCRDSIVKVTSEDIGDSGRSIDRIPDELRQQWKMVGSNFTVIPGKSKCANCGRPARPAETDDLQHSAEHHLCERCHFACFRCGGICKMKPETEKLICQSCFRVWDIGALGYDCIEDTGCRELPAGLPNMKEYRKEIGNTNSFPQANTTFGDEMNALTDYYFSLAIARPESPPL